MSSLQLVAQDCVELADAQVAAAAVLDARAHAMAPRLATAVEVVVQGAATLLHVAALCARDMRGAAAATLSDACATLTDAVEEACANAAQLTHAAALWKTDTRFDCNALPLADGLAFNTPAHAARGGHLALIASADMHVASVHVLATYDVEPLQCKLSGAGMQRYDPSDTPAARARNVIHIAPRDAVGAVAEWVTPADISLTLTAACQAAVSYELIVDAYGWTVTYAVDSVRLDQTFNLRIDIAFVLLWQGDVRVRVLFRVLCLLQ